MIMLHTQFVRDVCLTGLIQPVLCKFQFKSSLTSTEGLSTNDSVVAERESCSASFDH